MLLIQSADTILFIAHLPSQQGSKKDAQPSFGEKTPETIWDMKDSLLGLQSGLCSVVKRRKYSLQKLQQLGRANSVKSILVGNLLFYTTSGKDDAVCPHMDCLVVKTSAEHLNVCLKCANSTVDAWHCLSEQN